MNKLIHVDGDLIHMAKHGLIDILVHGCNCYQTMGAGFAKKIATAFPAAKQADLDSGEVGFIQLGNWSWSKNIIKFPLGNTEILTILNAYTQVTYGNDGIDRFEYGAFQCILGKLLHFAKGETIGFNEIGMGLAGGDRKRITAMLEDFATKYVGKVILVHYV
jgi:O-acetyl-ADP-ribose deacetylase (regulator of RNase III)